MDEKTFNEQYDKARYDRAQHLLDELCCANWVQNLSAQELWEALVERIEESINTEETEMKCILDNLADRLGRLEERESGE